MSLIEEENEESVAERWSSTRADNTRSDKIRRRRQRRERRRQDTGTESRVSLSQSHKSLLSALIVATRQRAAKHWAHCCGKSWGRGNVMRPRHRLQTLFGDIIWFNNQVTQTQVEPEHGHISENLQIKQNDEKLSDSSRMDESSHLRSAGEAFSWTGWCALNPDPSCHTEVRPGAVQENTVRTRDWSDLSSSSPYQSS